MNVYKSIIQGLNEAIEYEKGNIKIKTVPESKEYETFIEGVSGFTDDYFTVLESHNNDDIPSERETL